jgi:hypothetical protein
MMRILLLIAPLLLVSACRSCPTRECATLPALTGVPTTIHVAPSTTPCILAPRPQPYELVGMASPDGVLVTKSDLKSLLVWLGAMNSWAESAALCLESRR